MKLSFHRYGKAGVRVLKVMREGARHDLVEVDVNVLLEGDFAASFTDADNSLVVPTDTMKNTVNALAKDRLGMEIERFGGVLAAHFLNRYPQVRRATIQLTQHRWSRLQVGGQPHPHSFSADRRARPCAKVTADRASTSIESGIEDLLILKSAESGFEGFPKDEFTTLPETKDRLLATDLKAHWIWATTPLNYVEANERALEAMLRIFATRYSPSVQATLFEMGQAALSAVPELASVHLAMPNQHCLLVNLTPFGLENRNEIFVPTSEPRGQIEATVSR